MIVPDRRAHPRYPAWFPVNVRIDGEPAPRAGMLCDVSLGGALVWGFWSDTKAGHAVTVWNRSKLVAIPSLPSRQLTRPKVTSTSMARLTR